MKALFFTLFFLFFAFLRVYAQADYIINLNNDTLKGTINFAVFSGASFKGPNDSRPKKIKTTEVKEYYISKLQKNYCARVLPFGTKPIFLERVERGKIELFELVTIVYSGYVTSTSISWYASKDNSPLIILKHNSWLTFSKEKRKDELFNMVSDNAEVAERFKQEDSFTFKKVRELVAIYNLDAKQNLK